MMISDEINDLRYLKSELRNAKNLIMISCTKVFYTYMQKNIFYMISCKVFYTYTGRKIFSTNLSLEWLQARTSNTC